MIVIADTSPIRYLNVIGHIDILPALYGRVLLPDAVHRELTTAHAPEVVRTWLQSAPDWIDVAPPLFSATPNVDDLDQGEFEAIQLALAAKSSLLLIDEARGRASALERRIAIIGTIGILEKAGQARILDFFEALDKLEGTNFRLGEAHRKAVVERHRRFLGK